MLSGMPVEMLNRMLSRMLSRILDEISCTIPSRMPSEMLNEQTQALYQRFGISEEHSPEPPGLSKHKLYIRDLTYQRDTPLNPWSEQMLSKMLSEMPSRMLNEMISKMFDEMHNRMLSRMLDEISCRMPSRMLDSSKAGKRKTYMTTTSVTRP